MPLYEYQCDEGVFDVRRPMGEAAAQEPCPSCGKLARRVFTAPHFTEDRTRFWRNSRGTRFCGSLGEDLPDSRKDAEALARAKGVEFMTSDEVPANLRFAQEYGRHLKHGGDRINNAAAARAMSAPQEPAKTIVEALRESGVRLGEIPTDRPIAGAKLPAFPQNVNPNV
ncbi:MAG: zinc ribbon domain-containing protein [Patescibacteria group bacterium]|nr:zinc ribbon domain-containing protein [Patescibacteria group bacterium]